MMETYRDSEHWKMDTLPHLLHYCPNFSLADLYSFCHFDILRNFMHVKFSSTPSDTFPSYITYY